MKNQNDDRLTAGDILVGILFLLYLLALCYLVAITRAAIEKVLY